MQRNYVGKQFKWDFIILSLAFCFMFCVFAPLDAYFGNINEYWFTIKDLLPVILVVFAVSLCILSLFFLLLGRFKWAPIAFAFFTALLLFFYVQGNCIPRTYGVLNGSEIDWAKYTGLGLASIALAAICIILFLALILKFRDKVFVIGRYLALFIIAIQVMTLGTSFIQKNLLERGKTTRNTVVTDNNLFSFSCDGDNIVVLLLDAFDGRYIKELLEEKSELCGEALECFTWYRNTTGMYPTTKAALPEILTGICYENEVPYVDYVAKAYEQSAIYPEMSRNGYSLDVYTEAGFLSQEEGFYTNVFNRSYHVSDPAGFGRYLYRLVMFNYMPHQLKRAFLINTGGFDRFKGVSTILGKAYSMDVQAIYKELSAEGIKTENRGNVFKFFHLSGAHPPYSFGEELTTIEGESYTAVTEATGNMTLLKEVFSRMKAAGIYDESTIIIMADHGNDQYYNMNPIFMIKNRYEAHPLEISDAEMSFEYIPNVFTRLANGDVVDEDFISTQQPAYGRRRFLYYSWDNGWNKEYLPGMEEFFIDGNVWDSDSFVPSGKQFLPNDKPVEYAVGEELSFLSDATALPYCVYGFSACSEDGNLTNGTESMMKLQLKENYENLLLSINARPATNSMRVRVFANNYEVGSLFCNRQDTYTLVIPHSYLQDDILKLKFRYESLSNSQDAASKSGTEKMQALYMKSMTLTSTEQDFNLIAQELDSLRQTYHYSPGEILSFSKDSPTAILYMISGFSSNNNDFTWTDDRTAEMLFALEDAPKDLVLKMNYFTSNGAQRVGLSVNGHLLEEYVAQGEEEKAVVIPAEVIEDGIIRLRLDLPDACSPQSLGISNDSRELALGMRTMVISEFGAENGFN